MLQPAQDLLESGRQAASREDQFETSELLIRRSGATGGDAFARRGPPKGYAGSIDALTVLGWVAAA